MAGWSNLFLYGPSTDGDAQITSKRLLINKAIILYTPFRASEYTLEFSTVSWLSNLTCYVEETTEYITTETSENLILNELEVEFQNVNSKLNELLSRP